MKYVMCVYDGGATIRLTIGKIYEVLEFKSIGFDNKYSPVIEIEDNTGDIVSYSMYAIINEQSAISISLDSTIGFDDVKHDWFIDATPEIREQKINSILS